LCVLCRIFVCEYPPATATKYWNQTGVKLGIGGCIGVVIAIVGGVLVLAFFGSTLLSSQSTKTSPPAAISPARSEMSIPTIAQLVEEANTVDQRARLTETTLRGRIAGHSAAAKTLPAGVTSTLEGPEQTIMVYQGAICSKHFADAFIGGFLKSTNTINTLVEAGVTHMVITNGSFTTIREIKTGITRYYNQGFSNQR
jgi:hypothetical protein